MELEIFPTTSVIFGQKNNLSGENLVDLCDHVYGIYMSISYPMPGDEEAEWIEKYKPFVKKINNMILDSDFFLENTFEEREYIDDNLVCKNVIRRYQHWEMEKLYNFIEESYANGKLYKCTTIPPHEEFDWKNKYSEDPIVSCRFQ